MAFPESVLPVMVELLLGGTWTDITGYTFVRDSITITRGRADEGDRVDAGKCDLSLNNIDGRFSARNPASPYYGQLGRNTPIRVSVTGGPTYLALPGTAADYASTPHAAALAVTGDLDVRVDATADSWRTAADLVGKYVTAGDQRAWALSVTSSGVLQFRWSSSGASVTVQIVNSTLPIPAPTTRRRAVRATLDVNNGAGGTTVTFYIAATLAGPWTQLGVPVVVAGTTSVFNATGAPMVVGDVANLTYPPLLGQVHGAELRDGIAGTVVAGPDFTVQAPGATSFADSAGRTWTLAGAAELTNRRPRFVGEISSWPSRWDISGVDVWVPVQASGLRRRLSQGASPLASALRRELTAQSSAAATVAYWPCEDASGAQLLAEAFGGPPMTITGNPDLAAFEGFAASLPVPTWAGTAIGRVPAYTPGAESQVRAVLAVPAAGGVGGQPILRIWCSGSAQRWELVYGTGGTLALRSYNRDGDLLSDSGTVTFNVDGRLLRISVELTETGGNIDWRITSLQVGTATGTTYSGTLSSRTVGRITSVRIAPDQGLSTTAIGHLSVHSTITSIYDAADALSAWTGESAGRRIERLAAEEGLAFTGVGDLDVTAALGTQSAAALVDLLDEAARADVGILYEAKDRLGVAYRTLGSLYNQEAALALDYAAQQVAPPLEPVDDDADVRNDVTVGRDGGSSARAVQTTGPLSVDPPPAGVGRYDATETVNVASDDQLTSQAGWRLHLGTWDETRYPQLSVNLARPTTLIGAVAALDSGDRVTVANPPAWLPPETIDLIVQGYTEVLEPYGWTWTANCSPAGPYRVLQLNSAVYGRTDSLYSTLASGLTTSATSASVAIAAGRALWTTTAGDWPFDIVVGGEVMRVTAVSGTSSPQTFTVTRSINGVVKTHSAGAQVRLWHPVAFAL